MMSGGPRNEKVTSALVCRRSFSVRLPERSVRDLSTLRAMFVMTLGAQLMPRLSGSERVWEVDRISPLEVPSPEGSWSGGCTDSDSRTRSVALPGALGITLRSNPRRGDRTHCPLRFGQSVSG